MKRALLVCLLLAVGAVGCTESQTRDLGIKGLELYYDALVGSPFWPEGVEKPSAAVREALASTTWDCSEWAIERAKAELDKD